MVRGLHHRLPTRLAAALVLGGRAPAFSPADIAGLVLWLDAAQGLYQDSAGTTPAVADADPVGRWNNQAGVNWMAQTTGAKRPTLKLATLNGHPVIRFDGTDDTLAMAMTQANPITIFVVCTNNGLGSVPRFLYDTSTSRLIGAFNANAPTTENQFTVAATASNENYAKASPTGFFLHGVTIPSAAPVKIYDNGVLKVTSAGNPTRSINGALFLCADTGGTRPVLGDVAEFLIYDTVLSTADRQTVEAHLMGKYGLV